MKKVVLLATIILLIINGLLAHSGKAKYHVIIDTDCAPDDLRAIALMMASPDFEILAITTSDGLLKPKEGYLKILAFLKEFGHEGIPVAYGISLKGKETKCHNTCLMVNWGNEADIEIPQFPQAAELIETEILNEDEKVIIICLGPLTNIKQVLSNNSLKTKIDKIVWYCSDMENSKGTNFEKDIVSAKAFIESDIDKYVVGCKENNGVSMDEEFLQNISTIKNEYAQRILLSHSSEEIIGNIRKGYYKLWDDLLPVFLVYPELFSLSPIKDKLNRVLPQKDAEPQIKNSFIELLKSKNSKENKVFNSFPIDANLFSDDIKEWVNEIIEKYGFAEWRAGVIANELHGHLGIYAIIGVKMGIRVRQYFNIGVDEIHIVSFAGLTPPISCLNDGLQVSTGGTLGHGLIQISDDSIKRPEASFQFKNKKIKLRLKDEYWSLVKSDIKKGVSEHGLLTPEYWRFVRLLAIKYWKDWSRMEIFEICEIN